MVEIHSPPDLITSLARSVMRTYPSGVILQTSPVRSQPSTKDCGLRGSLVVLGGDPRSSDEQLTEGDPVAGKLLADLVNDLHLEPG